MNVVLVKSPAVVVGDLYAACAGGIDRLTWHAVLTARDTGYGAIELICVGHTATVGRTAWVLVGRP